MKFPEKFFKLKNSILLIRDAFFICFLVIFAFIAVLNGKAYSQSYFQKFDSTFFKADSVNINKKEILKDSLIKKSSDNSQKKKSVKFVMTKSPLKAVLLSAILPGLGQAYNESYWKLPIVAVAGGTLGYYIFYNNGKFLDYRDKYEASQTPDNPGGDDRYKRLRESYRDLRDTYLLYFAIFYLVNLADAYVDAHLYDFNVSDKIKLGLFQKGSIANFKVNF